LGKIKRGYIGKKGEVNISKLLSLVQCNPKINEVGALTIFCGKVRGYTHDEKEVQKLELEAYTDEAEKALTKISEDLRSRPEIIEVLIHHMTGTFFVGEDMVYVLVAGKNRKDVFSTLREAVERYKHEAPIWKKEYITDGSSYWVSEKKE
jgi:molybdopterin synthase catalytic subunit